MKYIVWILIIFLLISTNNATNKCKAHKHEKVGFEKAFFEFMDQDCKVKNGMITVEYTLKITNMHNDTIQWRLDDMHLIDQRGIPALTYSLDEKTLYIEDEAELRLVTVYSHAGYKLSFMQTGIQ